MLNQYELYGLCNTATSVCEIWSTFHLTSWQGVPPEGIWSTCGVTELESNSTDSWWQALQFWHNTPMWKMDGHSQHVPRYVVLACRSISTKTATLYFLQISLLISLERVLDSNNINNRLLGWRSYRTLKHKLQVFTYYVCYKNNHYNYITNLIQKHLTW